MRVSEGKPYPLGATADPHGANFAVFSAHATRVDVCIFDGPEGPEIDRCASRSVACEINLSRSSSATMAFTFGLRRSI